MRDGDSIESLSPPVAHATNGTTERKSDSALDRENSRELKGLIDPRHFENHPRHDSVFTHGSATASRSTSVAPLVMRKKVGSTITGVGTDLDIVPETSPGEVSGRDLRLGDPTGNRATAPHRATTGRWKRRMKPLPQTDPDERPAVVKRKEVGDISDDGVQDKARGIPAAQSSRCTRSQLGRTAPPETPDVEALCTECRIRARTNAALDCARYVYFSSFSTKLTTFRCRRHAQIYELPWPKRYDQASAVHNCRDELKRKREDEPGTSRPKKRTRSDDPSGTSPASKGRQEDHTLTSSSVPASPPSHSPSFLPVAIPGL